MVPGALEAALASVSLFDRLRPDELGCVAASFELVTLAPGASREIAEGVADARMVVVVCGQVDLIASVAGQTSTTRLELGDRYGDVPLMTGVPRAVSLKAAGTGETLIALLDRAGMDAILARYPAVNLPLAEELAQELARKNDHVRQILELHAAGLPEDELKAAVDERRHELARHAVRVRRLGVRALFHRFVVREGAEPPFWMLVGFLVSLAGARVVVGLILKYGLEKQLFALVPGQDPNPMHVHHFNYGLVLIAVAGLAALFPFGRRGLRVLAATFGFGAGLVFDEFALFWNLNPEYSQSLSLIASAMAVVVLVQLTYFRGFWGAVFRRGWHAVRGTS
jgi:CRP-like cAMP-binding protein